MKKGAKVAVGTGIVLASGVGIFLATREAKGEEPPPGNGGELPPFDMSISKYKIYDKPEYSPGYNSAYWHVDLWCDIKNTSGVPVIHSLWIAWAQAPDNPNDPTSWRLTRKWGNGAAQQVVSLDPAAQKTLFSPWMYDTTWNQPCGQYHGWPTRWKYHFMIMDEAGNTSSIISIGDYEG